MLDIVFGIALLLMGFVGLITACSALYSAAHESHGAERIFLAIVGLLALGLGGVAIAAAIYLLTPGNAIVSP